MTSDHWHTVKLPAELCAAAEERWGRTFESLDDLLVFVLRQLLQDESDDLDAREERLIEERLRELGYVE